MHLGVTARSTLHDNNVIRYDHQATPQLNDVVSLLVLGAGVATISYRMRAATLCRGEGNDLDRRIVPRLPVRDPHIGCLQVAVPVAVHFLYARHRVSPLSLSVMFLCPNNNSSEHSPAQQAIT